MANDRNAGRKRKLTPVEEMHLYEMHRQGVPMCEIISNYKLSESTIRRIVKRVVQSNGK